MITLMLDGLITTIGLHVADDASLADALGPYLAPGVVLTQHEGFSRVEIANGATVTATDVGSYAASPPPASKPARAPKAAKAPKAKPGDGDVVAVRQYLFDRNGAGIGPATIAEIAAHFSCTPTYASACLTALGPEIVKSGRARGTRYALASAGDKAAE